MNPQVQLSQGQIFLEGTKDKEHKKGINQRSATFHTHRAILDCFSLSQTLRCCKALLHPLLQYITALNKCYEMYKCANVYNVFFDWIKKNYKRKTVIFYI